jgi:hypothetical protein
MARIDRAGARRIRLVCATLAVLASAGAQALPIISAPAIEPVPASTANTTPGLLLDVALDPASASVMAGLGAATAVPEPGSMLLLGGGLFTLALVSRKRRPSD